MAAELATGRISTEAERLEQAEALVRNFCGWHIAPTRNSETATILAPRSAAFMLPSLFVTAVASVTRDGSLVDAETYDWSTAGVVTLRSGSWSGHRVAVEFTHGYATPPAEVTAVVQSIAQRAVDNPGSVVRVQDGPFSETYSQTGFNQSLPLALLDAERDILRRYRIPAAP